MTKRIIDDHKRFRDVISGKTGQKLRNLIKSGQIVGMRPKGGKFIIPIKTIDTPYFVHGDNNKGLLRGPGQKGDIIGGGPDKDGDGDGDAGDNEGDMIEVQVDLEHVLHFLQEQLELPKMQPKPNETYDEIKIKYNDISVSGPESLRHTRRTLRETMKRLAMVGKLDEPHLIPGVAVPMKLITPINRDKRYRQYREIRIPSSNAVIFFARDCSASMDDYICDIVSDTSWWIDVWLAQFYKKIERCYVVHDTSATEVDQKSFYQLRQGGGTKISSAFQFMLKQLENRFPPHAYNIYVFYFTDGDNFHEDDETFVKAVGELAEYSNLIGFTQVCPSGGSRRTAKQMLDEELTAGKLKGEIRTVEVAPSNHSHQFSDNEERNQSILEAIKKVLAKKV